MRGWSAVIVGLMVLTGGARVDAKEKSIKELPKDVWNLAFIWTEPIKGVARETRRLDPVSGVWIGLIDGSVKSVERTAKFFFPTEHNAPGPTYKEGKALLRYTF